MKPVTIVQLYPRDMNIYGDWGNTLTLKKRLEWHGYTPMIVDYNVGDSFPSDVDIIVGGGGQDSGQLRIADDLQRIKPTLINLAKRNTPMLVICGLYQLFGNAFHTKDGTTISGIGLFDLETHGSDERLIGNITTQSDEFGEIIGFENHSGLTYLDNHTQSLGTAAKAEGNNLKDTTEGTRVHNVIGTYLHGSLLPKNPQIADWLIEKAITNRGETFTPAKLDDSLAQKAREQARTRPR